MLHLRRGPGADGQVVVAATGEVDLATAPQLAEALTLARGDGVREIVVDLAAVDFMDSAGVRVLVEAARDAAQAGATLSIREAHDWVARVLEITGVDEYLQVQPRQRSTSDDPGT